MGVLHPILLAHGLYVWGLSSLIRQFLEGEFCELRELRVLGSSSHTPAPPWAMMYALRKEPEQGKRALLAFTTAERCRASHPTVAWGHPLGGAGVRGSDLGIHPLAAQRIRGLYPRA
jgi:hypothetical protein